MQTNMPVLVCICEVGKHPYLLCNGDDANMLPMLVACLLIMTGPPEKMACVIAIIQHSAFACPLFDAELQPSAEHNTAQH